MLRRCLQMLGLGQSANNGSRRRELGRRALLLDQSFQSSRDISVRIVHAGGREELYENSLPAAHLMDKYPGMCIARPEVFKNPHESLLSPEEELLTGQKYLMIPQTTAKKLKRKHKESVKVEVKKVRDFSEVKEEMAYAMITADVGKEVSDESFCSAKDFYSSEEIVKGKCSRRPSRRKGSRLRKPFVAPIKRGRLAGGFGWEPSLTSIQELSP